MKRKWIDCGFIALCLMMLCLPALFADWGKGFEETNLGFREALITANSAIHQAVLLDSGTERVTLGKDGMLFLTDTLRDFCQLEPLTQEQLAKAAKTLKELDRRLNEVGSELIVLIAPNKNTIYPQYMPFYTVRGTGTSDMSRLTAALEALSVETVDVLTPLLTAKERVYYLTDTHWNDAGALIAYRALMSRIAQGEPYDEYWDIAPIENTRIGDLEQMAKPTGARAEAVRTISLARAYRAVKPIRSVSDMTIRTSCDKNKLRVLVSRDSFGDALFAPLANNIGSLTYLRTRDIEQIVTQAKDTDYVVYELAQRNIRQLIGEEVLQ